MEAAAAIEHRRQEPRKQGFCAGISYLLLGTTPKPRKLAWGGEQVQNQAKAGSVRAGIGLDLAPKSGSQKRGGEGGEEKKKEKEGEKEKGKRREERGGGF